MFTVAFLTGPVSLTDCFESGISSALEVELEPDGSFRLSFLEDKVFLDVKAGGDSSTSGESIL